MTNAILAISAVGIDLFQVKPDAVPFSGRLENQVFPAAIVAMKFKNPCHGVLIRQVAGQTGY